MFGIRFVKFQPSEYVMKVRNGKVVQEGIGLSFLYFAPVTSVMVLPVSSIDAPFMFEEMTADYQTVTLQGQLTYRIEDYHKTAQHLDYTYHLNKKNYLSDDPGKLSHRVMNAAKVLVKKQLAQLPLRGALQAAEHLADSIKGGLQANEELDRLGIEVLGASILAILPSKETLRALEAEAREAILRSADDALYERRNASIEQERKVKENELGTEIAIEMKKKQIRETQLDSERLVMKKRNEMQEEQLQFDTLLEKEKGALIELSITNKKAESDAKAYEMSAIVKAMQGMEPHMLQSLANIGMEPGKLIAIAFQELAEKADKIGQLSITPELLQGLMNGSGGKRAL